MNTAQEALAFAHAVAQTAESWVTLHNALFGLGGRLHALFPTESERTAFAKTTEFAQIMQLLEQLRGDRGDPAPLAELVSRANGAISVRLPRSIHAALLAEAEAEGVSLNQLCVAKLCVQLRATVGDT